MLPQHWERLDAFEGPRYRRVTVDVATAEGVLPAFVYVVAEPSDPRWVVRPSAGTEPP